MVHEQAHLHDRQRAAFLAMTELHQTAFLLPLEKVVRQVIINHLRIALAELLAALVYIRLDFVELSCKKRQGPVHLLQRAVRLLKELPCILE